MKILYPFEYLNYQTHSRNSHGKRNMQAHAFPCLKPTNLEANQLLFNDFVNDQKGQTQDGRCFLRAVMCMSVDIPAPLLGLLQTAATCRPRDGTLQGWVPSRGQPEEDTLRWPGIQWLCGQEIPRPPTLRMSPRKSGRGEGWIQPSLTEPSPEKRRQWTGLKLTKCSSP